MTTTYQKTLALIAQLSNKERAELKSDLEDMTTGDLKPAGWIDELLQEGEAAIKEHGTAQVTAALWNELKTPYAS